MTRDRGRRLLRSGRRDHAPRGAPCSARQSTDARVWRLVRSGLGRLGGRYIRRGRLHVRGGGSAGARQGGPPGVGGRRRWGRRGLWRGRGVTAWVKLLLPWLVTFAATGESLSQ